MSVFALGRMRHLDLLAEYFQRHPDGHERYALRIAGLSANQLAAILAGGTRW